MNENEKKDLEMLIGAYAESAYTEKDIKLRQLAVNNYEKLVRLKLDSEKTEADIDDKKARIEADVDKSERQHRIETMKTVMGGLLQGAVIVGSIWQVTRVTKFTETNYLDSKPLNFGVSLVRDGFRKFI